MKIVNKRGIPEAIFNFLSQDFYDYEAKSDSYSATELLKPTQEIILTRRHGKEIEVDAIDRLWSLFGQGIHAVLEKERGIEPIVRVFATVNGIKVSGKWDRVKDKKVTDYKVTSAWTIVWGSRLLEWKEQLSIYRWLYWKSTGNTLDEVAFVIAILRDWTEKNIDGEKYPESPVIEIPITTLSLEETEKLVTEKLAVITGADLLPDELLPKCTDEERWFNKKTKNYMKCAKYCQARNFCQQNKSELVEA